MEQRRYYNGYDDYSDRQSDRQGSRSEDSGLGYRGNAAYDLSLFEPRPVDYASGSRNAKKKKTGTDKKRTASSFAGAVTKGVAKAGSMDRTSLARFVAMGIIFAVAVGVLLSCQMEQHELMQEISAASAQLEELEQEYLDMSVAFETKMSNSAIEEYAVSELGMQKRENSQTEWVSIGGGDVFEYTGSEGQFSWLQEELDELLSYMD